MTHERGGGGVRGAPRRRSASSSPRAPEVDASLPAGRVPARRAARASRSAWWRRSASRSGAWRLDPTAHPFCTSFSNRDVRLTTRYRDARPRVDLVDAARGRSRALRARDRRRARAHAARRAPSLGINESQSRTWENLVGRSRPFWQHWYEPLQETFPSARRRRARRVRPRDQPRRAGPDPGRRRRDDVQPAHHPALRARAGARRGHRSRSRTCPRPGTRGCRSSSASTCRTTRTASCRTSTGRAAAIGLLPDLRARERDLAPDLAASSARRSPTSTRSSRPATCCRSPTGSATTSTRSAAS